MLSVCIPVYNFSVSGLVESLIRQAITKITPIEIILIDDFSDQAFRSINREIKNEVFVKYHELEKNIGRAAIRNLFLKFANFENMLFLDCDSQIPSDHFIENYLKCIENNNSAVCGGTIYNSAPVNRINNLRWKYGTCRESESEDIRNKMPYHSFKSNNFLITKSILSEIRFDERLTGYGHEDTFFGYRLEKQKIPLIHISNPVLHDNSESQFEFLQKTRHALQNLWFIVNELKVEKEFYRMNRLIILHSIIRKFYLQLPLLFVYLLLLPFILFYFSAGFSGLLVFDFYKLGYYTWIDFTER